MSYAPTLATAASPSEHWEDLAVSPCVLAATRALVAGVCVADLLWRDDGNAGAPLLLGGLSLYGAWCALIAIAVCRRWSSPSVCRSIVRALDLCAIGLLAFVDDPFGAPLFLLLSFGFVVASYNGGPRQAFANTTVVVLMLAARWALKPLAHPFGFGALAGLRHLTVANPLIVAAAGTLFTWTRHRRLSAVDAVSATTRLIGSLRAELGVRGVLRAALAELLHLSEARAAVLVVEHCATRQLRLVVLTRSANARLDVQIRRIARSWRATYLLHLTTANEDRAAAQGRRPASVQVFTARPRGPAIPVEFRAVHPFDRLCGFAFRLRDEWNGRLFLLDPSHRGSRRGTVTFIRNLLEELVPVVSGICDLHALRRRAADAERARLGRELHDGIVQELFGIDMELELLRQSAVRDADVAGGLERVQQRLHTELSALRRLMQRARSHEVDPARLPQVLHDMVDRFASDSGIAAQFVCDRGRVELPPEVCGQLTRILQEALVNVRRHSRARHVIVRFRCDGHDWRLSVQDDGCGFQPWLPVPSDTAGPIAREPAVISERVRAIGGTLRLENARRGGARLEMSSRSA